MVVNNQHQGIIVHYILNTKIFNLIIYIKNISIWKSKLEIQL